MARRLDVSAVPPRLFASWLLLPRGEGLQRAWSGQPPGPEAGLRSMVCDFTDPVSAPLLWSGWPSHSNREYDGSVEVPLLLTVSWAVAEHFRPDREFDVYQTAMHTPVRRWPAGTLIAPAMEPLWLTERLAEHLAPIREPNPAVQYRWPAEIQTAEIDSTGRILGLSGVMGPGEVVARLDFEEAADQVTVRVWIGIDPSLPQRLSRTLASGPASSRSRGRTRPGRRWRTNVVLARPLGCRLLYDGGYRDTAARSAARRAWLAGGLAPS